MNQHDQISEVLRLLSLVTPFDEESENFLHQAESLLRQSLAVKPALLVRLTDVVIGNLAGENMKQSLHATKYYLHAGDYANAIMDAMQEKNK